MKAISLHQPWASLVMLGYKHYETRSWKTSHRGPLAIHAAKHKSEEYRQLCATDPEISAILAKHNLTYDTLPLGAILGVCQVGGMSQTDRLPHIFNDTELACGDYSPGRWAWQLYRVESLVRPLPCRGFQQLWTTAPEMRHKLLTREAFAEALSTRYGGLVQADDIRDLTDFHDAEETVHVQATRDCRTDWYEVTVTSTGELDPSTIVQLPF